MGERCLPKMNEILNKELMRTTSGFKSFKSSYKFDVYEQFSMSLGTNKKKYMGMSKTFPVGEDEAIQKLM